MGLFILSEAAESVAFACAADVGISAASMRLKVVFVWRSVATSLGVASGLIGLLAASASLTEDWGILSLILLLKVVNLKCQTLRQWVPLRKLAPIGARISRSRRQPQRYVFALVKDIFPV